MSQIMVAASMASGARNQRQPAIPPSTCGSPRQLKTRSNTYGTSTSSGRKPTPLVMMPRPATNPPSAYQPQAGPNSRCRSSAYSEKVVSPQSMGSICAPRITMMKCSVHTVINAAPSPASRLTRRRPKS